jgi:hypothetical protein
MLITSFYAGLRALIFLALSVKVVGARKKRRLLAWLSAKSAPPLKLHTAFPAFPLLLRINFPT